MRLEKVREALYASGLTCIDGAIAEVEQAEARIAAADGYRFRMLQEQFRAVCEERDRWLADATALEARVTQLEAALLGGGGRTVTRLTDSPFSVPLLEDSEPGLSGRKEFDPNVCANCGHSKELHFRTNAYVPGKCDYQYDLCSCRDFRPGG